MTDTWRGLFGWNVLPNLNRSDVLLLDFCAIHGLFIMNTMFEHKALKHCWHQNTLGPKVSDRFFNCTIWRWTTSYCAQLIGPLDCVKRAVFFLFTETQLNSVHANHLHRLTCYWVEKACQNQKVLYWLAHKRNLFVVLHSSRRTVWM